MIDMRKFEKIYADAEEKFVKAVVLFGKNSDDYLYSASTCTENDKIDKDTLMELLKKGVVVSYENAFYQPIFFKENAGAVEVTIATAIGSGSSTAVLFYSKEHSAD